MRLERMDSEANVAEVRGCDVAVGSTVSNLGRDAGWVSFFLRGVSLLVVVRRELPSLERSRADNWWARSAAVC